jgi:glycosyltransferase involved in cell wall biosynthesis
MRILLMTDWNPLSGGAEVYARTLRAGLRQAGDDVRLLTSGASPEARRVADDVAWASDSKLAKAMLQLGNPFAGAKVREMVRRFHPDVAYVNMFALYLSPAALTALGEVPFVLSISDYKLICPTGAKLLPDGAICRRPAGRACLEEGCLGAAHWLRDQLRYRLLRRATGRARQTLACSRSLQRTLREAGIDSEVETLPVQEFSRDLRSEPAPEPLFLFVGRLDREKGVDVLLHAFARLRQRVPRARLRIAGRGPLQASLEALADRLDLSDAITFCGWRDPTGVEEEMDQTWALVAPSRWAEPFGLVAVEALVRGVPAIVTEHGGLADSVEHGVSGLHVPPGDALALAAAMEDVATTKIFPTHRLEPRVIAGIRARHDLESHVRRLRDRFEAVRSGAKSTYGPKF